MKKRKWLLILVIVVLILNILLFTITKYVDVNKIVKQYLVENLGSKLNSDIDFLKLNVTTKYVQFSDLSIHEKNDKFVFKSEQLYVSFSFWKLIFSGLDFSKSIRNIKLFSPVFTYKIDNSATKKNKSSFSQKTITNIIEKSPNISIIDGKININDNTKDLIISEGLDSVNLKFHKLKGEWVIDLTANNSKNEGKISLRGKYSRKDYKLNLNINNYKIAALRINDFVLNNCVLNTNIPIIDGQVENGICHIQELDFELYENNFLSKDIKLQLLPDKVSIVDIIDLHWENVSLFLTGEIGNYLSKKPQAKLKFYSNRFESNQLNENISGFLKFSGKINNNIYKPLITLSIFGTNLAYKNFQSDKLDISAVYKKGALLLNDCNIIFNKSPVNFNGIIALNADDFKKSKIDFRLEGNDINYELLNSKISFDFSGSTKGIINKPELDLNINNIRFAEEYFDLNQPDCKINYYNGVLSFLLENKEKSISIKGKASDLIDSPQINASFITTDFSINKFTKARLKWFTKIKPVLNSNINLVITQNDIRWDGLLNFDQDVSPNMIGDILTEGRIPIKDRQDIAQIIFSSDNLEINKFPYSFDILIHRKQNNLLIKKFNINDEFIISGDMLFQAGKKEPKDFKGLLKFSRLPVNKVVNIIDYDNSYAGISGFLKGNIIFDSSKKKIITGRINLEKTDFNRTINDVYGEIDFSFDNKSLFLENINFSCKKQNIISGRGELDISNNNSINLEFQGKDILIKEIIDNKIINGRMYYDIILTGQLYNPHILCNCEIMNGKVFKSHFNKISLQFFQDSTILYLKEFSLKGGDELNINASGKYSYNIFQDKLFQDQDGIHIQATGDFLSELSNYIDYIGESKSDCQLDLEIGTEDQESVLRAGNLKIKKGEMKLIDQYEKVRNINIDLSFDNNLVNINKGSLKLGLGTLKFKNKITNTSKDIFIYNLNTGVILLTSDDVGLSIHVPKYTPRGAHVNAQLTGFNDDYFEIYNEDDKLKLSGKILFSNGKAKYEEQKTKKESGELHKPPPIIIDIDLVFKKNIWYVVDPLNLNVDKGNFISLRTNPESGKIDVFFDIHSHNGEIRLFGETFQVERVDVSKGRNDPIVKIDAVFTNKTADGSTIYLFATSVDKNLIGEEIRMENLGEIRISLKSDNPKDETMLSILSKLHYGKDYEDLTEQERAVLGREEMLKLAGDRLGELLLSTFIAPLEGAMRHFLGLDYFRLKTSFMKNLMKKSGLISSDEILFEIEEESEFDKIERISKDIILKDLSISMGKYLTSDWYLNYEALFQKGLTTDKHISYGVQHKITFRYELPWNFRLVYMYQLSPFNYGEKQSLTLETVFYFW